MIIQTETNCFQTEARGVIYHARLDVLNRWEVYSHRKALGARHVGTVRHFDSLAALGAGIKAFRGIELLAQ